MKRRTPWLGEPSTADQSIADDVEPGTVLTDITGKRWKLGETIGTGGFGQIYLVSDRPSGAVKLDTCRHVAKIERHSSGPLFAELHYYLNVAKQEKIDEWTAKKKISHLGMPHFVASGSHMTNGMRYRFIVLPRYGKDLQHVFESKFCKFNLKTVITIARQTLDALQYIHDHGYIHSDVKASNILMCEDADESLPFSFSSLQESRRFAQQNPAFIHGLRSCRLKKLEARRPLRSTQRKLSTLRPPTVINKLYLVDYGLASKYITGEGTHKHFSSDIRKAHLGTTLFCSRDAHLGAQSRRSDLECLGFNMIYWLTSNLPWSADIEDNEQVFKRKKKCLDNLNEFLDFAFGYNSYPPFLYEYFRYLEKLDFEDKPDYAYCASLFCDALKEHGYMDNLLLEFEDPQRIKIAVSSPLDNRKNKKKPLGRKNNTENLKMKKTHVLEKLQRTPLKSNLPMLRKQFKQLKLHMNWSKILIDPNLIMKKWAREKSSINENDYMIRLARLDLTRMNPTQAMQIVYNRYREKTHYGKDSLSMEEDRSLDNKPGYTYAMMDVYRKIQNKRVVSKKESSGMKTQLHFNNRGVRKRQRKKSPDQRLVSKKKLIVVLEQCERSRRHYSLRG